ncbi:hypothetical protein Scep_012791 [Stephania cephalantha]|uniref:Uncharacterized protein n=1 Tax=Stephania cephalantha TaxID=152367 RepID=A0AAP0JHJ6_9MAGN
MPDEFMLNKAVRTISIKNKASVDTSKVFIFLFIALDLIYLMLCFLDLLNPF